MNKNQLDNIEKLIGNNNIQRAEMELSKLGPEFFKNSEYLYLRSKIFFLNKLYYIAIDTLLIALEFEENNKIYNLLSNIYNALGNELPSLPICILTDYISYHLPLVSLGLYLQY